MPVNETMAYFNLIHDPLRQTVQQRFPNFFIPGSQDKLICNRNVRENAHSVPCFINFCETTECQINIQIQPHLK